MYVPIHCQRSNRSMVLLMGVTLVHVRNQISSQHSSPSPFITCCPHLGQVSIVSRSLLLAIRCNISPSTVHSIFFSSSPLLLFILLFPFCFVDILAVTTGSAKISAEPDSDAACCSAPGTLLPGCLTRTHVG